MTDRPNPSIAYRLLMAASLCSMVVFGAGTAIPGVCLESIGRELHLDFAQRGLITTARMVALFAALLFAGWAAEHRGKRIFLVAGLSVVGLGQVLTALATGYFPLLAAQAIAGAGKGVMEALVNPLVAALNPVGSARALNVVNALFSVGLVIGALSTGEILQSGGSWRIPFVIWTLPALLCAGMYFTRRYPAEAPPVPAADNLRRYAASPLFLLLFAGMVLGGGCEAAATTWAPNFMEEVLGASARGGAWTMALYGTFMALGRFAGGALLTVISPWTLMLVSASAGAISMVGLAYVHSLWGGWLLFGLSGLFVACFWPTLLAVAGQHIAAASTSLFALLAAAGIVGCMIIPWVIGLVADAVGLRVGMMALPVANGLLLLILLLMRPLLRPSPASAATG